jgi:single-stranded DNA-binding protein
MIDGLIAGKLLGTPERRIDKNAKQFVVAKVIAAAGEGEGEGVIVNVIAFDATTGQTLLDLQDGDSLALTGALTPRVWTDKQGAVRPSLDLVAHRILSARDVQLERKYPSGEAK